MKKIISLLLAATLFTTVFAGCGNKEEQRVDEPPVKEEVDLQVKPDISENEKPDEPPQPPADDANSDHDSKPTAPPKPSTAPPKPSTTVPEKPDTAPDKKPENKPAGEQTPPQPPVNEKVYSISEIHKIIKNTYGEDYRPNTEIPQDALTSLFGINLSDVEEFIAEQPMISANIDTFIAIRAKAGKGSAIETALLNYKTSITEGAMMYPSNIPKAQAAQVVRHGDYVFLVMLGAAGEMEADEATQLSFAKEQVKKGVNAINNYFAK